VGWRSVRRRALSYRLGYGRRGLFRHGWIWRGRHRLIIVWCCADPARLYFGLYDAGIEEARQEPTLSISFAMLHSLRLPNILLQTNNDALGHSFSMALSKAVRFRVSSNTASAVKAARVIRSIKSRYRTQAFLFLAYHFFLTSPLHLDIFIIFFILVSNFMNRQQAFPSQLVLDGLRFLLDERRFIMP